MVSEARIHHYLPQCYLRGFTDPGGKKAELFVYDLREERVFSTHPKNIGARRDFNRIEIDGHRQDALEQGFASFEGHAAAVLKRIRHAQRLPEGEDFFVLMNLIGLIAVRNPHHRKTMNDFHAEIARSIMDLTFATKDQLEATIRKMKPMGA